jgi:pSer/pThr/pTyr-binding forkhead associated (FHA) protein
LRRSNDGVFLTDLGSTNGTRVNGAQVREQILVSGDEVSVGSAKLIFEMT